MATYNRPGIRTYSGDLTGSAIRALEPTAAILRHAKGIWLAFGTPGDAIGHPSAQIIQPTPRA